MTGKSDDPTRSGDGEAKGIRVKQRGAADRQADGFERRGLSTWMLAEFINPEGMLHPVLAAVQDDPELDLEIRNRYVNIYYRGTNLMQIDETGRGGERLTPSSNLYTFQTQTQTNTARRGRRRRRPPTRPLSTIG